METPQSALGRFLGGMATPRLFLAAATLLGLDLLIPDVIPFVDEALLAILTLLFARRKSKG
ncbi:MAG: DUF6116 family protein [Vicinamibacterales bacterium]